MTSTNVPRMRRFYKEGRSDYFMIRIPQGDVFFTGQFPEYGAAKYAERILSCENCLEVGFWNGVCIGLCANCGKDTGYQKGFVSYGEEYEDESTKHLPSVFKTYLSEDWDLKRIGDKKYFDTIGMMVDELYMNLITKFGSEKQASIVGLCDYLRSLKHIPREAIARINESREISKDKLDTRNWAHFWDPLYSSNRDEVKESHDGQYQNKENAATSLEQVVTNIDINAYTDDAISEISKSEIN